MSDAVVKQAPKKPRKAATKQATPKKRQSKKLSPTARGEKVEVPWDGDKGFESAYEAIEDLKNFVQTLDVWEAEDCLRMMTNLGLLQRFVDRVDYGRNFVMLGKDDPLDEALNRRLGPLY